MSELSIKDGLSCLFGMTGEQDALKTEKLVYLPTSEIIPTKNQPRKKFNDVELNELANSIKKHGILQPILVRKKNEKYEIIAGERRYRASILCGIEKIPCLVEEISDETAFVFALIENIQRKNLNAIEEAEGFQQLVELHKLSHEEASQYVGKSRSHITNSMRLLKLVDPVKKFISEEKLSMGQGRALLALPESKQLMAAHTVINLCLNARQTEALVQRLLDNENNVSNESLKPIFLSNYSARLSQHLESKFKVSRLGNKFSVQAFFDSETEFNRFLHAIGLEDLA